MARISSPHASDAVRIAAPILRAVFMLLLAAITARVCLPQSEQIWQVYDSPRDLARLALGGAFCGWILFHAFSGPKDAEGYRAWFYFGLAAVPFALICLIAVW